jgi:hypothetical protein
MASTHAAATSAVLAEESGPQAGPLPSKRGEIGFIEGVHTQPPPSDQPVDQDTLPARHPADRPPQLPSSDEAEAPLPSGSSPVSSDSSSTNTVDKYPCRWRNKLPEFMGIHSMTFLLIFVQLVALCRNYRRMDLRCHGIGWPAQCPPPPSPAGAQNLPPPDHSSNIFVNVAFAVVVIAQLIFLERRVYRVRAERYAFKHPGETLPRFASAQPFVGRRHDSRGTVEPTPPSDVCGDTCSEWCRDWRRRGCGDRAGAPASIRQDTRKHTHPCRLPARQPAYSSSGARGKS